MATATLRMLLLGEDRSASSTLRKAGLEAEESRSRFASLGKTAAGVFAGGALFMGAERGIEFLKDSAKAAMAEEQAQAVLARQIHNTTGASEEQIHSTEDWLKRTSEQVGIARDQLVPQFTKLTTSTGSLTKSHKLLSMAMNVSAGTGKSLSTITDALVRAQNGSVGGLSRLGIATKNADGSTKSFLQVQKELTSHFKGDAASAAQTTAGQLRRLGVMWEDFKISVGQHLLPVLATLGTWFVSQGIPMMKSFASFIKGVVVAMVGFLQPAIDKVRAALAQVVPWFDKAIAFLKANPTVVKVFVGVLIGLAAAVAVVTIAIAALNAVLAINPFVLAAVALAALAAAFVYAYQHSQKFRTVVQNTLAVTKAVIMAFVHGAEALWHQFGGNIIAVAKAYFNMIVGVVKGELTIARGIIKVITSAIHGDWSGVWHGLVDIVKGSLQVFVSVVKGQLGIVLGVVKGLPGKILSAMGHLDTLLFDAGKAIMQGLINGIDSMVGGLTSKLHSITKLIPIHKGPIEKDRQLLRPAGVAIMQGLNDGLEAGKPALKKVLGDITNYVKAQKSNLASLLSDKRQFAQGFQSFTSSVFGQDLSTTSTDAQGNQISTPGTVASMLAYQKQQRDQARSVDKDVTRLRKLGLSKDLIEQLQASGASGIAQIHTLAGGSRADIRAINQLNAQTRAALAHAGSTASDAIFGKDIVQARNNLDLAEKIAKKLREELHKAGTKVDVHVHLEGKELVYSINAHHRKQGKAAPFK